MTLREKDLPISLRAKINIICNRNKVSWDRCIIFLLCGVVSPLSDMRGECVDRMGDPDFFNEILNGRFKK